jgi:hypothetical protein
VQGFTASTFQVTAYSYQAVDDGVTVTSTLRPLEYAHFVGSPSTGVAALERDLSFATAMAVSRSGHAPVSLFAGAWEKYYPMVTEGFAEVSALDVQPGAKVAMQTPYVSNTGVTRQMVRAERMCGCVSVCLCNAAVCACARMPMSACRAAASHCVRCVACLVTAAHQRHVWLPRRLRDGVGEPRPRRHV